MKRVGECARKTGETDITIAVNLDGTGKYEVETGIGFFNHMLELFSKHSMIDCKISCKGDLAVDGHHSVEDTGIALGSAIAQALGDKRGIWRYGTAFVPMDETLCRVALDISGRPYLVFRGFDSMQGCLGNMDVQLAKEFFRALAVNAGLTLHIELLYGENYHHMLEAAFKACGQALRKALEQDPRQEGIPSTKGIL